MKKILSIFLSLFLLTTLSFSNIVNSKSDNEDFLFSNKSGPLSKIYHYGTGEPVTLPKKFTVYESEMRGVWVATVYNIAIGKQNGLDSEAINSYKKEFLTILDRMEEFGMNTLFFQIRPSNDAFYKSELNPWSEFLVSAGVDPGWDPLEWMIEETHKRGFDFQCWMNAYRVTTYSVLDDTSKKASTYSNADLLKFKEKAIEKLAPNNFARIHPEYVVMGEHDTRLILNPSEIAVQDFIVATLKEIIENYDIDGMHFDDYFYLNGSVSSDKVNTNFAGGEKYDSSLSGKNTLNDLGNYQEYLNNNPKYAHMERGYSLGDFRRENINVMMRRIRAMVDEYNETNNKIVEFGSKPAAVWRSNSEYCTESVDRCSPDGSNTVSGAYSSYSDLFADTWKWVEEGLVDYVAPQVYYAFEDNVAAYADIVDWWAKKVTELNKVRTSEGKKEIKLYVAHGIYKYRDAPSQFYNPSEIRNQIVYNKKYPVIKGSALYSYENLYVFSSETHEKGISFLKNNWVNNPVYPIQRGNDDSEGLVVKDYKLSMDTLDNSVNITFDKMPSSRVYGIYKVLKGTEFTASVDSRINVTYDPYVAGEKATLRIYDYDENYDYYVKVVSTNGYVSSLSTKLDFTNMEEYESIKINYLSQLPTEIKCNETINLRFNISNLTNHNLEYTVNYFENDVDKKRVIASGSITSNTFEIPYKAYPYTTSNSQLKITITDGTASISVFTNKFNTVNEYTQLNVKDFTKIQTRFSYKTPVSIDVSINSTNDLEYNYVLLAVNEANYNIVEVKKGTLQGSTPLTLDDIKLSEGTYHFVLKLTQNDYSTTYTSNTFKVIRTNYLDNTSIKITDYNPVVGKNIIINISTYGINGYNYKLLLLDNDNNIIKVLDEGIVEGNYIGTMYKINENDTSFKIRVIIDNKGITEYLDSNLVVVKKEVEPDDPTPTPVPDDPVVDDKKGCNCKKSILEVTTLIITLTCFMFIVRKRK